MAAHESNVTPARLPTGPAAAALLAAGLGLLALGLSQVLAEASEPFKQAMQALGDLWMPGARGIGPYSGKETLALVTWLVSWLLLHVGLRRRHVNVWAAAMLTLLLIGAATTILWPPVTHLLVR